MASSCSPSCNGAGHDDADDDDSNDGDDHDDVEEGILHSLAFIHSWLPLELVLRLSLNRCSKERLGIVAPIMQRSVRIVNSTIRDVPVVAVSRLEETRRQEWVRSNGWQVAFTAPLLRRWLPMDSQYSCRHLLKKNCSLLFVAHEARMTITHDVEINE